MDIISIYFKSNRSYVLGKGSREMLGWVVEIDCKDQKQQQKELENTAVCWSRAIMGHWYPIVSIDFHEHAMIGMMV